MREILFDALFRPEGRRDVRHVSKQRGWECRLGQSSRAVIELLLAKGMAPLLTGLFVIMRLILLRVRSLFYARGGAERTGAGPRIVFRLLQRGAENCE